VVFRRRLLFLTGAGLFAFVALVGACWYPLKYTGLARFERRSDSASPESATAFESLKLTLEHELTGKNAVEMAVDRLEKEKLIPALPRAADGKLLPEAQMARQQLVLGLEAGLKVWFDVRSPTVDLVSVTFTDHNSKLAERLPNVLVTGYIDRTSEQIVGNLTESHKFLEGQVKEANARLQELMAKKINFEKQYAGQLPDSPGALNQQIERLATEIDSIRRQRDTAERRLRTMKDVLAKSGTAEDLRMVMPGADEEPAAKDKSAPPAKDAASAKTGTAAPSPAAPASPKDKAAAAPTDKPAAPAAPDEPAKSATDTASGPKPAADSTAEKSDKLDNTDKTPPAVDIERPPDQVVMVPNPELVRLQDELRSLKKKLDDCRLVAHMKPEHPTVITITKQIEEVEDRIAKQPARVEQQRIYITQSMPGGSLSPGGSLTDAGREYQLRAAILVAEVASAQEEVDALTRELTKREARLASLHDLLNNFEPVRQNYLTITRDVLNQSGEVERYQKQLTEINMNLAAEAAKHATHINQVEMAQEQFRPSSPNLTYVLAFAVLGGLAFGSGLVLLANMMDRSITTTEEAAEYFGLPVCGVVGEIVTTAQQTRRKIRRFVIGPAAVVIVVAALCLAGLNIVLWLYSPLLHDAWRPAPASFLGEQLATAVENLRKSWM